MALCALFTALLVAASFIRIPTPLTTITLQAQVALLAGVLLGGAWGALSVLLYLLLGLLGLPVFATGGGFSYVLQPTFGYLIGLVFATFLSGVIAKNKNAPYGKIALAFAIGLFLVYAIGTIYAAIILTAFLRQTILLGEFLLTYVFLTLPKDILLCAILTPVVKRLTVYTR